VVEVAVAAGLLAAIMEEVAEVEALPLAGLKSLLLLLV